MLQSTAIFLSDSNQIKISNMMVNGATGVNGSALYAQNSSTNFLGQNVFINNSATDIGGAILLHNCISNFSGNISFFNNIASQGGALALIGGVHNIFGNILFVNNSAKPDNISAAALNPWQCYSYQATTLYIGNGGAIHAVFNSTLSFETTSNAIFTQNTATCTGGAISVYNLSLIHI